MSNEIEILLIVVGVEVIVVFALLTGFLIRRNMKGKKADVLAAGELVKNVQQNESGRRESLLQVFRECYSMEEEELNLAVDEFLNRERAFYKTMISVYVNHDAEEFSKMSVALQDMVKPYSDLALSADPIEDNEKLEALQQQNEELGKELNDSKKVMDELLSEYSATFDKEGEGNGPDAVKEKTDSSKNLAIDEDNLDNEIVADNVEEIDSEQSEEDDQEEVLESLDLVVEDSHDIEVAAEEENEIAELEIDFDEVTEELAETELNEVSLDEFDEELESETVVV